MSDAVRSSLRALADRARRGDLDPLTGLHGYSPEAAENFRHAAVLALLTPSAPNSATTSASENPTAGASATTATARNRQAATEAPPGHHPSSADTTNARTAADHPTEAPVSPSTVEPVGAESLEPVGADLFLVQRSPLLRHHPGQIALPGGGLESSDAGPEAAAVRETEEETGISPERVEVLGKLPALMLPISSFVVTPVLGWAPWIPPVTTVQQDEVLHTLRVPVDSLLEPQMRSTIVHGDHTSPGFRTDTGWVWGFTGILLDHLFTQLGWARPWDTSVSYTMSWDEARGAQLLDP